MGALICRFVLQVFVALVFSFYLVFSDLIQILFSNAYTNGLAALLRPEEGDRNGSGAAEVGLAVEEIGLQLYRVQKVQLLKEIGVAVLLHSPCVERRA